MCSILRTLLQVTLKKCNSTSQKIFSHNLKHTLSQQAFQTHGSKEIGPFGWFLLIIPGSTFALGTWQLQRKQWKENLIAELKARTSTKPIQLPRSLEEIYELEYYPVHVRGQFLHDKEMYLGPRSLIRAGDAATGSSLFSAGQSTSQGYLVITPFKLADRDETILINRGWVPRKHKDPSTRVAGQIQNVTDVIGIIRLHENRPQFMPANKPEGNSWLYRDINQMCEVTGTTPIFLDATNDFAVQGGPVGGQTRLSLRNEHLSYVVTWYCLSAVTSYMWYSQFIKRVRF